MSETPRNPNLPDGWVVTKVLDHYLIAQYRDDEFRKVMKILIVLAALFGVAVAGMTWSGFVLSFLWGWFFVPAFGVPAISVPSAIGIVLIMHYMTNKYQNKSNDEITKWEHVAEKIGIEVMKPAVTLLIGLIVKQWM